MLTTQNTFKESIRDNLKHKKEIFDEYSLNHKKMGLVYRSAYYIMGGTSVLFTVVCSALSAALSRIDPEDQMALAIFIISLIAAVLGSAVNFFGMEERISKHNSSKIQYKDMSREIEVYLLSRKDEKEMLEIENILLEREKFIASYEPSISPCLV